MDERSLDKTVDSLLISNGSDTIPIFNTLIKQTLNKLDKMVAILQTTFLNEFCSMEIFVFWLQFHWSWLLGSIFVIIIKYKLVICTASYILCDEFLRKGSIGYE